MLDLGSQSPTSSGSMLHDLSPIFFRIYGDLAVRWYGLSYVFGFLLSYLILAWMASRQRQGLKPSMVGDFVAYGAIGVLIGGRLGYCLFYSPDLFLKFKVSFPFWGVLAINEGGMSSHGGMLGLFIATSLFAAQKNLSPIYLYDLVALVGPLGVFWGRLANYVNGELIGRICPDNFPLSVRFPTEILTWPKMAPQKLQELAPLVEKLGQINQEQWLAAVQNYQQDSQSRSLIYHQSQAIIEAVQNKNIEIQQMISPILSPRYPSQLFAAALEGLFIFIFLFILWRKPRKSGVISSLFLILYSISRIAVEAFREPDPHIGLQIFDLTRGQILSIVMLIVGLILAFLWGRGNSLSLPGWSRGQNLKLHRR